MIDDIVAQLRAPIKHPQQSVTRRLDAADEIERLRAELAAEREFKRANIELAEQLVTTTAERDALRAELATERARADAHYRALENVTAKNERLTAERDALRAAISSELDDAIQSESWDNVIAVRDRLDAALNKGGDRD